MSAGKIRRMQRLLDRGGRTVIVAVDHSAFGVPGPPEPYATIAAAVDGGADAILASWEIAHTCAKELRRAGLILRLDGGASVEAPTLRHTVEEALQAGADAVCAMIGAAADSPAARSLGAACARWEMPLLLEFPFEDADAGSVAAAARAGMAAGADMLKLPFVQPPPLFADLVRHCTVPVVILGGSRVSDDVLFGRVAAACRAGAAGVAVGRNVWQRRDPGAAVRALAAVIREGS